VTRHFTPEAENVEIYDVAKKLLSKLKKNHFLLQILIKLTFSASVQGEN
jgi:hypothetical protein